MLVPGKTGKRDASSLPGITEPEVNQQVTGLPFIRQALGLNRIHANEHFILPDRFGGGSHPLLRRQRSSFVARVVAGNQHLLVRIARRNRKIDGPPRVDDVRLAKRQDHDGPARSSPQGQPNPVRNLAIAAADPKAQRNYQYSQGRNGNSQYTHTYHRRQEQGQHGKTKGGQAPGTDPVRSREIFVEISRRRLWQTGGRNRPGNRFHQVGIDSRWLRGRGRPKNRLYVGHPASRLHRGRLGNWLHLRHPGSRWRRGRYRSGTRRRRGRFDRGRQNREALGNKFEILQLGYRRGGRFFPSKRLVQMIYPKTLVAIRAGRLHRGIGEIEFVLTEMTLHEKGHGPTFSAWKAPMNCPRFFCKKQGKNACRARHVRKKFSINPRAIPSYSPPTLESAAPAQPPGRAVAGRLPRGLCPRSWGWPAWPGWPLGASFSQP